MNQVNWDNFKCRCSGINKILSNSATNPPITELQIVEIATLEAKAAITDKQKERLAELLLKQENSKIVTLSDTCIEYLMEVYAWKTEGMISVNKESMDLLQTRKGKVCEEESIKVLSIVKGMLFEKNAIQIENDFLTGEPDIFVGDDIYKATVIDDVKSKWDYPGFLKTINKPVEKGYQLQVRGYGNITGAQELYISNVLVDTPDDIIEEFKWKAARKFDALTIESPEFLLQWEIWKNSMLFGKTIPVHKRVWSQKVEPFTEFEVQKLYDRVKFCREWLHKFHEKMEELNA